MATQERKAIRNTGRYAGNRKRHRAMAKQNVTVRIEPELVDWFRTEAGMSLSEAVTQGLEELRLRLRQQQLSAQIQRELEETEALVSQQDKDYWADLAATDA